MKKKSLALSLSLLWQLLGSSNKEEKGEKREKEKRGEKEVSTSKQAGRMILVLPTPLVCIEEFDFNTAAGNNIPLSSSLFLSFLFKFFSKGEKSRWIERSSMCVI